MFVDEKMLGLLAVRKARLFDTIAAHLADPENNIMTAAPLARARTDAQATEKLGIGELSPQLVSAGVKPWFFALTHLAAGSGEEAATPELEARRRRVQGVAESALSFVQGRNAQRMRDGRGASYDVGGDRR